MNNETTASQPKSIGDDAQFRNLLFAYLNVGTTRQQHDVYSKIIAHIDSRAPAAQASATIQVAPDVGALTEQSEAWLAVCEALTKAVPGWQGAAKTGMASAVETIRRLAATIQEPVMAAEPVGEKLEGTGSYPGNYRDWDAAPMVADPAGVESLRASFESWCIRNNFSTNKWPDGVYLVSETVGAWEGWQAALATTVKAEPSESLDAGPFTLEQRMPPKDTEVLIYWPCSEGTFGCAVDEWSDLYEDPIGMGGPTICVGEGWMRYEADVTHWAPIPVVNFAAPLADKTGGGE